MEPNESGPIQPPVPLAKEKVIPSKKPPSPPPASMEEAAPVVKSSRLKHFVYFLVGFIFSVLGLVVGILWIFLVEKKAKLRKFIYLILGVTISTIGWYIVSAQGGFQFISYATRAGGPEIVAIKADLAELNPNFSYKVLYGENNPPLTIGNNVISTYISVKITSDAEISSDEIETVAQRVCATLDGMQMQVSSVLVEDVRDSSLMSSSTGQGGTCEEWNALATTTDKASSAFGELAITEGTQLEKLANEIVNLLSKGDTAGLYEKITPGLRTLFTLESLLESEKEVITKLGEITSVSVIDTVKIKEGPEWEGKYADMTINLVREKSEDVYVTRFVIEEDTWWLFGTILADEL